MLKRFLLPAAFLLAAPAVHANILLTPTGSPTPDGAGGFNWTYDAFLQPGARLVADDAFVLYDVAGLKTASFMVGPDVPATPPDSFNVTFPSLGPTPGFLNPTDTAGLSNVAVTLSGPATISHPGAVLLLGTLTVDSTFGTAGNLDYGSLSHKTPTLPLFAFSSVAGPVPEPSTYGFMGIGLAAIAALGLRKTRRGKRTT
jgi:hypothetical protein